MSPEMAEKTMAIDGLGELGAEELHAVNGGGFFSGVYNAVGQFFEDVGYLEGELVGGFVRQFNKQLPS
jgi:hypothetical protein